MTTKKRKPKFGSDLDLGTQLRQWRKYTGLKQSQLEEQAGLAHNAISRIEKGEVSPKLETVERLSQALGISVEELQFRTPPIMNRQDYVNWVQRLVGRLEDLPPEIRHNLLKTFHSIIDLMEQNQ